MNRRQLLTAALALPVAGKRQRPKKVPCRKCGRMLLTPPRCADRLVQDAWCYECSPFATWPPLPGTERFNVFTLRPLAG